MIVGSGLLAKEFSQYYSEDPDTLIFASGVSNSTGNDNAGFLREKRTLQNALRDDVKVAYFSTCSISDPSLSEAAYVAHKREMEDLIRQCRSYEIFRLPQVVGKSSNRHTLTNYIHTQIQTNQHFEIWRHAHRNIIDVSDVALIANTILQDETGNNRTINIASPFSLTVIEIVQIFEKVLGKKAQYSVIDKGKPYLIDTSHADKFANRAGVNFSGNYVERVIQKYYGDSAQ